MASSILDNTDKKIGLEVYWKGSCEIGGGCSLPGGATVKKLHLKFKNPITSILMEIPRYVSQTTSQRLYFTFQRLEEDTQTYPKSLVTTAEQIKGLKVWAEIHKKTLNAKTYREDLGRVSQKYLLEVSHEKVPFKATDNLEVGKMYKLTVDVGGYGFFNNPDEFIFSSSLEKEEKLENETTKQQKIMPPLKNVKKESITPEKLILMSEFDKLTIEQLRKCLNTVTEDDKELEKACMEVVSVSDIEMINRIINKKTENIQLLLHIYEAFERKLINSQISLNWLNQNDKEASTDIHQKDDMDL